MKRLLPAPLLSLALFALWLVLNASVSPGHLLLGALVAFIVPIATSHLRPQPVRIRRPDTIVRLMLRVGFDVLKSNFDVAAGVWRKQPPRSAFVKVPIELRDPNGLAVLAMIMCVIPGTVWSELSLDRRVLLLHVFDLEDEAGFIAHLKQHYEHPLKEIFE